MKNLKVLSSKVAVSFVTVLALSSGAFAAPPVFTTLTDSIDFSTAAAAILLAFAGLMGVLIVMKGGSMILSAVKK